MTPDIQQYLDSIPNGEPSSESVRMTFTNFAEKNSIRKANGNIYGRFGTSVAAACIPPFESYFPASALISMRDIGPCPNGQMVVLVEHY